MKKLLLILLVSTFTVLFGYTIADAQCVSGCTTGDTSVRVMQSEDGWEMHIFDDSGTLGTYSGSGQYGGTICGGFTPCQL